VNEQYFLGEPLRGTSCRSRRAIRSITRFIAASRLFRGWFRYYPSRKRAAGAPEVRGGAGIVSLNLFEIQQKSVLSVC
jgi:hypothetical protein